MPGLEVTPIDLLDPSRWGADQAQALDRALSLRKAPSRWAVVGLPDVYRLTVEKRRLDARHLEIELHMPESNSASVNVVEAGRPRRQRRSQKSARPPLELRVVRWVLDLLRFPTIED